MLTNFPTTTRSIEDRIVWGWTCGHACVQGSDSGAGGPSAACHSGPTSLHLWPRTLGRFIFSGCLDTKLPPEQTCMQAISQHPNKTDQISGSACLSPCLHAHAAAGSDFLGSAPQPSGGVRPFLTYPSCCLSREGRTEEYAEAPPACRAHAHMKGKKERSATRLLLSHNTPPCCRARTHLRNQEKRTTRRTTCRSIRTYIHWWEQYIDHCFFSFIHCTSCTVARIRRTYGGSNFSDD
jgi:hypothetical protein